MISVFLLQLVEKRLLFRNLSKDRFLERGHSAKSSTRRGLSAYEDNTVRIMRSEEQ
jgi:hypothetical protein